MKKAINTVRFYKGCGTNKKYIEHLQMKPITSNNIHFVIKKTMKFINENHLQRFHYDGFEVDMFWNNKHTIINYD